MRLFRLRATVAAVASSIAIFSACDRPTSPNRQLKSDNQPRASVAAAAPRAAATIYIGIQGNSLDSAVVTSTAAGSLQIALGGTVTYDKSTNLVRVPLVLRNTGTVALKNPARIYGWEDSLIVRSPNGQTNNGKATADVDFSSPDSSFAATAPTYPGAVLWRFDTLLAPTGQPQRLAAGAQSGVRWIEISVKRSVKVFTANIQADAVVASIPSAPIHFVLDSGVAGRVPADTSAFVGDLISYSFTPKSGFTNVQVRVEDTAATASGAVAADTVEKSVYVTADRIPVVPPGGEDMYAKAQAVLTAADIPTAYQAYLDAAYAYLNASTDSVAAVRGIRDVQAIAFDFLSHEAALRHADSVLTGYSFRIGPDAADPGGAPILNSGDTGIVVFNRIPGHASRSVSTAALDTIEPTTFIFRNGVFNTYSAASTTALYLEKFFVRPIFPTPNVTTRLSYNSTYLQGTTDRRADCVRTFTDLATNGLKGINSFASYMAACMQQSSYLHLSNFDLVQCVQEVWQILMNQTVLDKDAAILGNDIQRDRRAGRHVVVVAHSQGNLHANAAIHFLKQRLQVYTPGFDSSAITVMSLASPVSARWDVPNHFLQHVVIDGDPVPPLGFNEWERISTRRSRQIDQVANRLGPVAGPLYRAIAGIAYLHPAVESYLADEAGAAVHQDIPLLYGASAVATMEGGTSTATAGLRQLAPVTFRNSFGDPIQRVLRASQYTVANPSVVQTSPGVFLSGAPLETGYTATRLNKTASGSLRWIDPIPPEITGTWSGTWTSETDLRGGSMSMTISGNIFTMSANVGWTDQGANWTGGSTINDDTNHLLDSPGQSQARFWMVYQKPGAPGIFFFKFVVITTRSGSNVADGVISDGSGIDAWTIHLTRPHR